ncbi:phage tail assembly protein T [Oxalicibacterium faecigallinarum]|uniref:Minor tail T domain-containing protein n=1 Tax=Oxalicibacterium faecigallinarum TaxID=573741 RepID=A0A8J3AMD2_9BURK|nr:hypothetical protein [Oxalicibacterium faecigallinarum]GGI16450.1 hypothetical protein GCM10008066_04020 [Oxalicibacterium faecigallinarum]
MPAHQLAAILPEREFVLYQAYAVKRMLPQRRQEMYLAQICSVLAQVHSNTDVSVMDFLFDPVEEIELDEDEVLAHFDFKPRNKG